MDLTILSGIATVLGLPVTIAVAIYQHRQAAAARSAAGVERQRAADLERHLASQRWQQLRSLGDQIDAIEQSGRHRYTALDSAIHARLREQFSALIGVIATSTPSFSAGTVRRWASTGRLRRPWQIAEAIAHLDDSASDSSSDAEWLRSLLEKKQVLSLPAAIPEPLEPTQEVAAYILLADAIRGDLEEYISHGGQCEHAATLLLSYLAKDCVRLSDPVPRKHPGTAIESAEGGTFRARVAAYQSGHFHTIHYAATESRRRLEPFRSFFHAPKTGSSGHLLLPTDGAVEIARVRFPALLSPAARCWSSA